MATKPKAAKIHKPGRGLARPGDPLIVGNGEKIEPVPTSAPKDPVKRETVEPSTYRPNRRRTMKEIPGELQMVNAVAVVFMYTMLGVGDREIADALKTTTDDIESIRNHSAYSECFEIIHGEFINANSDLLTSRIASYSRDALETVGHLVNNGKKEETRLKASTDILDRAGVRPKDQDNRTNSVQQHLRIIVVDGDKSTNVSIQMGEE